MFVQRIGCISLSHARAHVERQMSTNVVIVAPSIAVQWHTDMRVTWIREEPLHAYVAIYLVCNSALDGPK